MRQFLTSAYSDRKNRYPLFAEYARTPILAAKQHATTYYRQRDGIVKSVERLILHGRIQSLPGLRLDKGFQFLKETFKGGFALEHDMILAFKR